MVVKKSNENFYIVLVNQVPDFFQQFPDLSVVVFNQPRIIVRDRDARVGLSPDFLKVLLRKLAALGFLKMGFRNFLALFEALLVLRDEKV